MIDNISVGRWPDFICIGAIKSGTTWLHSCLDEHPAVFSPSTKELEYFNNRYELGSDWYKSQFPFAQSELCGESTPGYMHEPSVAQRIYDANPNMKLMVCLRNPVDRAYSHFMMANRLSHANFEEKLNLFDEAARDPTNKFVSYGLYAKQLKRYIELFGREQIHVALFEDIQHKPAEVLSGVYRFLGINAGFSPSVLNQKINAAGIYRAPQAFSTTQKLIRYGERSFIAPIILWLKTNGVRDYVLNLWRKPQANPGMLAETRAWLDNYFTKPNQDLEQLLERDLSVWER